MKSTFFHISVILAIHEVFAKPTNKVLRKELEEAANESRDLAHELEEMLLRLEGRVVGGHQETVPVVEVEPINRDVISVHNDKRNKLINSKKEDKIKDTDKKSLRNVENILKELNIRIENLETDSTKNLFEGLKVEESQVIFPVEIDGNYLDLKDDVIKPNRIETQLNDQVIDKKEKITKENNRLISEINKEEIKSSVKVNKNQTLTKKLELEEGKKESSYKENSKGGKEYRLKSSLEKLEKVAKEIENLAKAAKTDDEVESVHQLSKILEDMTAALTLEELRVSVDVTLSKEEKINTIEENIESMLKYLKEVLGQLKEQTKISTDNAQKDTKRKGKKIKQFDDRWMDDQKPISNLEYINKKRRQAKYRNMLTKFYFGRY